MLCMVSIFFSSEKLNIKEIPPLKRALKFLTSNQMAQGRLYLFHRGNQKLTSQSGGTETKRVKRKKREDSVCMQYWREGMGGVWLWSKGERGGGGGVTKTQNLRHVWVRLGEYRRVWEERGR